MEVTIAVELKSRALLKARSILAAAASPSEDPSSLAALQPEWIAVDKAGKLVEYWEMLKKEHGGGRGQMSWYLSLDNRLYDLLQLLDDLSVEVFGNEYEAPRGE